MATLNEVFTSLAVRRRYEVWFVRLGRRSQRPGSCRYTWVRDASFSMEALWIAACPDEARHIYRWLTGAVAAQLGAGHELQIMFGIGGEHDLSERSLEHLTGWRDSRPVRIGNGAWCQRQLDVYGELFRAARRLRHQIGTFDGPMRELFIAAADTATARWQESGPGNMGGSGRSSPLPLLETDVLGGARRGCCAGWSAAREGARARLVTGARTDSQRHSRAWMERSSLLFHPVLRVRRAGRLFTHDPHRWFPSRRRPAGSSDHPSDLRSV